MSFHQDFAYAFRALRGHPLFMLTAVLLVAVGIAGATSVFSVGDAMLLRSSPGVASPHRLIEVGRIESDGDFNKLSYADYVDLRDRNAVLEGLAAVDGGAVCVLLLSHSYRTPRRHRGVLGSVRNQPPKSRSQA